ncbi:glycosyltransferase [Niallia circulans]|uniref:glycosyltransferase n=1 Tax=Niallia circulans TaxID=1397 RepID=UPI002E21B8F9|nr:glycosyltransferase [Niallia circulans]
MRNNNTKISIITACFNSEKYIEQTIQSVINQTYKNIEYIIIDGGSTDKTLDIIEDYIHYIDIIVSEKDEGIYDAFNKGINLSSGDYIYFLNSDDYLYDKDVIFNVVEESRKYLDIKLLYGNVLSVNEQNGYCKLIGEELTIESLKMDRMPSHQGIFMKRELFFENGLFDKKYKISADFDLLIKVFKQYNLSSIYIDKIISVFRTVGYSSSLKNMRLLKEERNNILKKHFNISKKSYSSIEDSIFYYKKWIEHMLIREESITKILKDRGINNVVIFGTTELSLYLINDLKKSKIEVKALLDNSPKRQNLMISNIPIFSPDWLSENQGDIDLILLSFEGNYEKEVTDQIYQIYGTNEVEVISWKEIVENNYK